MNTDPVLQPMVVDMLRAIETVLNRHHIDFYLVGAVARDIHLSAKPGLKSLRATKDVDIAVLVSSEEEFQTIREELIATGYFEAHSKEVVKLFYKQAVEVDLLPFGGVENEARETRIEKPRLFVMDVPGFKEAYPDVIAFRINELAVNVCSVEGLIILKLMAFDDQPHRTKDITDIDSLIHAYFDLYQDEIFEKHFDIMGAYETALPNYLDLISARVIGRNIKQLLAESPDLLQRIDRILSKRPTDTWQAMLDSLQDK